MCLNHNSSERCEVLSEIDFQFEECYKTNCYDEVLGKYYAEIENKIAITWSQWSECVPLNKCSFGYKYRRGSCGHTNIDCDFAKIDVQSCVSLCKDYSNYPWSIWSKWSSCINQTTPKTCYKERYCYGLGCSSTPDKHFERQYAKCESGVCQSELPIVDLKYIWERQGPKLAKAFFKSNAESERSIYTQKRVFLKEANEKKK